MSRTLRAAGSVSALTLVSRVLGFVRDVVMFRALGSGWVMGTFILAWMFPNLLRRLMGEGALSASFIPAYTGALEQQGPAPARRLLATVTGVVTAGLLLLTAVVWLGCALLPAAWFGAGDGEEGQLLVLLVAILFPYVVLVCLVAVYSGALNAHRQFAGPAAMPVVLNVFWIAGLVVAAALYANDQQALAVVVAGFLLLAGFAQLGLAAWQLHRRAAFARPRWAPRDPAARAVFVSMAPTVLGMSILQLNTLLDQAFAYYLIAPGANGHVYMANRLLLFPHALTSLALATAAFPVFSSLALRGDTLQLGREVSRTLRTTLALAVPASAGLALVAGDFMAVFFVGGEYTEQDAWWATRTTATLVAGLPFLGAAQLYARVLYALGDTRTPARWAAWLVPINLLLNVVLAFGCGLGVVGLTTATSACAVVQAVGLRAAVRRRCALDPLWRAPLARVVAATAVMALTVWGTRAVAAAEGRIAVGVLGLALPIAAGIAAYAISHRLLGGPALRGLLRPR